MTTENFTPSLTVRNLAAQTIERHGVSPETIRAIAYNIRSVVDQALRAGKNPEDALAAGFDSMNILWDKGHSARQEGITRFPAYYAHEYVAAVTKQTSH